jgi:hypothetical protein
MLVERTKISLSKSVAFLGGFPIPNRCFTVILWSAPAKVVHRSGGVHGISVLVLGRAAGLEQDMIQRLP